MDFREIGWKVVDWINLAEGRDRHGNELFDFHKRRGISWLDE
jgi:hypothetical protein